MKVDESKILLLLSGILCGIVMTAFMIKSPGSPIRYLTYKQYQNGSIEINSLSTEIAGLNKEENELQSKLKKYESSSEKNQVVADTLKKELDDTKKFYGLTDVSGPGLIITINDRHNFTDESDLLEGITHDEDLLLTVNDLINEGNAEAVSINDNRIVSTSYMKCAGPVTTVNNEYVAPPFIIKAIGDPDILEKAFSEGHYVPMTYRGLKVSFQKVKMVKIEALKSVNEIKYIKKSQ